MLFVDGGGVYTIGKTQVDRPGSNKSKNRPGYIFTGKERRAAGMPLNHSIVRNGHEQQAHSAAPPGESQGQFKTKKSKTEEGILMVLP